MTIAMTGLAYTDTRGRIYYRRDPLAARRRRDRTAAAPRRADPGAAGRRDDDAARAHAAAAGGGVAARRTALAALLPAGYTRLLLPAYRTQPGAPALPLFGYTFACVVDDELYVAAMRTDESEDWTPRYFGEGELEALLRARQAEDPRNRTLAQLAVCSRDYGCFTAQNVFLERGEAALPVSPKCNAACVGCISELAPDAGMPSPQTRVAFEADADDLARIAIRHLERVARRHRVVRTGMRGRAAAARDDDRAHDREDSRGARQRHDQPQHERLAAQEPAAA